MSTIKLYDREQCPYSKKVRDKLDELDLEYDETVVPDAHAERSEVEEATGQTGVPVILDDNMDEEFLADSDDIVRYLERQYS
ncbi:Glutaredoxin [Halovenus aranensis]|uniref:Glutaredoxin n=1 Tax=Halovenus aranensis TaxID=890420 RepID=A0A1G8VUT6_9EURY|nr:glutathione S-transferase N-terminal domain-containing protein [Halovenus aranensis]SDJ69235.1 Glutaredoxin [Halovenus aranensis]